MGKNRKTYQVKKLVEKANDFFLNSADHKKEERHSIFAFVADILHDTGNYRGFNYLYKRDMKKSTMGYTIGINHDPENDYMPHPNYDIRFKDTDDSRVFFYS